jgi:hypothetical protein
MTLSLAEPEGGDAPVIPERRADEVGQLGTGESGRLGVRLVSQQAGIDGLTLLVEPRQVVDAPADVDVIRVVEGGLRPHGPALPEVLLGQGQGLPSPRGGGGDDRSRGRVAGHLGRAPERTRPAGEDGG